MPRKNERGRNPFITHKMPETWADHFTENDRRMACEILQWLNNHEHSISYLAKLSRIHTSTFNRCVKGDYKTDPSKFLRTAMDTISMQDSRRNISQVPFVKTTVSELVTVACERARRYRNFSMVTGFVGTGKTRALKEYKFSHENTFMIEADPGMSVQALLDDLIIQCGCSMVKTSANQTTKFKAILTELSGTDSLLIIDEAETLTTKALHYLRRIRDKAGIGIVLSGTESLEALIKPEHGEFDQIRSRVGFWPNTARGIKREDAEAIITCAFADLGDIDEDVTERLWQYSNGSMRMLVEDLIPAIRDFGLAQHDMSVGLVDSVASKVLNLSKPVN